MHTRSCSNGLPALLGALAVLGGCLAACSSGTPDGAMGPGGGNGNAAPTISGSPAAVAVVGQQYVFTPGAADPDGDPLTFSISNRPSWAAFDTGNGRLSGVPAVGSEGTYAGIQITVSDGSLTASTPVFSVEVMQSATGSATLLWDAPSENTDGSVLTDLAAYRIYYGTSAGNYPNEILIDNPGITTYVVENLPPDTYYFVSTAINSNGIESGYSNMATAVVN